MYTYVYCQTHCNSQNIENNPNVQIQMNGCSFKKEQNYEIWC